MLKTILKYAVMLTAGGSVYVGVELLWRGYSHWSMMLAGGVSLIAIGVMNDNAFGWEMSLTSQMFLSGAAVTAIELIFGVILNIWLDMGVWDYSGMPHNFLGQICMSYFGFWQILSVAAIVMYDYLDYALSGCAAEKKPRYKFI